MVKAEEAVSCFKKGFSCSQSVFSVFSEQLGLDQETALKVAGGFGGGMGRMGETCGALTGAFMAIGLKYSAGGSEDANSKAKTYEIVADAAAKFKSINGHILCRDLLGCDISTHEGHKIAADKKLFSTLCPKFIEDAAGIVEELV